MRRTPIAEQAYIAFARQHYTIWSGGGAQPPVIGLSTLQLQETSDAVDLAEAAYTAALAARDASKAATEAKDNALAALKAVIGADIDTIDAFAKATKDPNVWVLAQIPAPKDPSERDAPPAPTFGEVVQTGAGFIRGTFTVASGGGAQYQLQRRDTTLANTTGPWTVVGVLTDKAFEDQGVPVGLSQVEYRVSAQLSTGAVSPWSNAVSFSFGSQGSPETQITAGSIVPVKAEDQKSAG
ncbi:MAG: hypothetical protein ACIAS6_08295 [Phycisphaerales bacterium JB060]